MLSTMLAKLRIGPFQWGAIAPWRAARVALGVLAPLVLGWASGQIEYGAFAALGALPAGFAAYQGVTRSRIAAIVVASVGMAVTTFVGATTTATLPWLLVPVVTALGYVTGLAVALGPLLSVAVLQWSVGLLIAVGLPQGPAEAGTASRSSACRWALSGAPGGGLMDHPTGRSRTGGTRGYLPGSGRLRLQAGSREIRAATPHRLSSDERP